MRVIKPSRVKHYAAQYPDAAAWLMNWLRAAKRAAWTSLVEVRKIYRSADDVMVNSGKIVTVFNVRGNKYRLIVANHYNRGRTFILRFMTHAEYDKDKWKDQL